MILHLYKLQKILTINIIKPMCPRWSAKMIVKAILSLCALTKILTLICIHGRANNEEIYYLQQYLGQILPSVP